MTTTTTSRRLRWISSQDQLSPLTSDLPICILNESLFMLWRRCVQHVKLPLLGMWGTWCWFFFVFIIIFFLVLLLVLHRPPQVLSLLFLHSTHQQTSQKFTFLKSFL